MSISENDVLQARNEGKTIYVLRMDAGHDAQINGRTHEEIIDDIKDIYDVSFKPDRVNA